MDGLHWLLMAVFGVAAGSIAVSLLIGAILADIGQRASELLENEFWSLSPPTAKRSRPEGSFVAGPLHEL